MPSVRTVITESPITANRIRSQTNERTMATYGHLFDYAYEHGQLQLHAKTPNLVAHIANLNDPQQLITIATDSDQQGELIAAHIRALTPRATHQRVVINRLDKEGIEQSLQRPLPFNDALANEGAYLRVLNLKLSLQRQRNQFLTTTNITLAKSFDMRGRLDNLENYTIEHESRKFQFRIPKVDVSSLDVTKAHPATTRQLTTLAAYDNRVDIMERLQRGYEDLRVSYIRTDAKLLPPSNTAYEHHIMNGELKSAHYAIYNLVPYSEDEERHIYKLNETAVSKGTPHALRVIANSGCYVAIDERISSARLSPKAELLLHLSLDTDAFVSSMGRAISTYEPYFYNGQHLKEGVVKSVLNQAERTVPEVLEYGIKHVIEQRNPIKENHQQEIATAIEKTDFNRTNTVYVSQGSDMNHFF
ncbi:toprim domain-containing protein [Vibrio sp. Hal054]|uniref:toprim domain-containing protein n=1 Tax=Vibrio sp. Hal054 TaxID=3035158 RepID=UPI00301B9B08